MKQKDEEAKSVYNAVVSTLNRRRDFKNDLEIYFYNNNEIKIKTSSEKYFLAL